MKLSSKKLSLPIAWAYLITQSLRLEIYKSSKRSLSFNLTSFMKVEFGAKIWPDAIYILVLLIITQPCCAADALVEPVYPVSELKLSYAHGYHPLHPPLEDIMNHELNLGLKADQYVAPQFGESLVIIRLSDLAKTG